MHSSSWRPKPIAPLPDDEFVAWQRLLDQRLGIEVPAHRRHFLETSLTLRMRELDIDHYHQYRQRLTEGVSGVVEWMALIDRITVQETRFFRDADAIHLMREHIERRMRGVSRPIAIWSVGCSTGEEPYSLAMVAADVAEQYGRRLAFGVTATDISTPALLKAREATYPERKLLEMPPSYREQFMLPAQQVGHWQVLTEVQARCCFTRGNLLDMGDSPLSGMDIIFCQNVLIYFRKNRRIEIVNNLIDRLRPGGLLILGAGEVIETPVHRAERVDDKRVLAYRRRMI